MRLATTISAGAFIFLSAFILKNKEARVQSQTLFETKWSLKKIHTDSTIEEVTGKAFIKFNDEKKSAGGNGGCNTFGGSLEVSGNTLSIKNIFSTKMYCESVQQTENEYLGRLAQINRYLIKGKNLLLYKDETLLLEFAGE
jgi:heat shock protein HslJ